MNAREEALQNGQKRFLGKPCKQNHSGWRYTVNSDCVDCAQARQETQSRKIYEAKYRKIAKYQDYQKQYQAEYSRTEKYKQQKRKYAQQNKGKLTAKTRRYELAKLNRTPNWLSEDDLWMMEQAYVLADLRSQIFGFAWHVDHAIPLQGRLVSGLHVPHNLQVIPATLNQSKSNRYDLA
jgi:hypothetical protein